MAHHLYSSFSLFFARYGYWTIFLTVLLENTGVPAPGDTVVLFAGFIAHRGSLSLTRTIVMAMVAAVLGQCLGFAIGRVGGEAFIKRYQRTLWVSQLHFEKAQRIFLKNAGWGIFISRYIIVLRELAGLLSGVFRFPFSSFLLANISGAVVWSISMSCLGYFVSRSWRRLIHFFSRMDMLAFILFGIAVLIVVLRQRRAVGTKA